MGDVKGGGDRQVLGTRPHSEAETAGSADNPVKIGGKTSSSLPVGVTAGDRADAFFDIEGRLGIRQDVQNISVTFDSAEDVAQIDGFAGGSVTWQVPDTNTLVGTILFEVSDDLITWRQVDSMRTSGEVVSSISVSSNGHSGQFIQRGFRGHRIRLSAFTSGSAVVNLVVNPIPDSQAIVQGNVGDNIIDSGNPIKTGGKADSAEPTVVAVGNRVNGWYDLNGRTVVGLRGTGSPAADDVVKQVDDVGGATDHGIMVVGRRFDLATNPVSADGDISPLLMDVKGGVQIAGTIDPSGIDAGNPVKIGGRAEATEPTGVAGADRANAWFDLNGRLNVKLQATGTPGADDVVKTVDDAGGATDSGLNVVGRRSDTDLAIVSADGDVSPLIMDNRGGVQIAGTQGSGDPDAGHPVKIGGKGTAALPVAETEADRVNASFDLQGQLRVTNEVADPLTVNVNNNAAVVGNAAHDAVDANNPVKIGAKAIDTNASPAVVDALDRTDFYADRAGIPFFLGGHPNLLNREYMTTGVQTNDPIIDTIGATDKIVVTAIEVLVSNATTATAVQVRIGFGTTAVPTEPTTGNSALLMLLSHPGIAPGSGVVKGSGAGRLAIGEASHELRITCDAPTAGQITVLVTYYILTED